jgi:hypothetical protein
MFADAELSNPGMPARERIARYIARALGHNDDGGMYWERYTCASELILRECRLILPPMK